MIKNGLDAGQLQAELAQWLDVEPGDDADSLGGVNVGEGCPPDLWPVAQWALARIRRQMIVSGYLVIRGQDNRGLWLYDVTRPGPQRDKATARAAQKLQQATKNTIQRVAYEYARDGKACRLGWD